MEKKKAIKIATATAIAASAFTAVAPAQSEAATSLTAQMKQAKATIKKPFDTYYIEANDTKLASLTKVKNELAAAKKAKTSINAAIKKSNLSTKQKKAKYAEMKAYDKYITRTQDYVYTVSISVRAARNELTKAVEMGTQSKVLSAQTALHKKIAEFEKAVAKVYGKYTRPLLTSYYATPAKEHAASVNTEMKVYKAYKQIESEKLITTNLAKAVQLIDSVKTDVEKLRAKNTLLAKNLVKAADKNNVAYDAALDVKIVSVISLDNSNKYLHIQFDKRVSGLDASDIEIKDAQKGDKYGVKQVTLSTDGKSAQLEIFGNANNKNILQELTEYTITVHVNGKVLTSSFYDEAFIEGRVTEMNVDDKEFTVVDDDHGQKLVLEVPTGKEFDYQAALGEQVHVWYNADEELVNYEIVKASSVTDAIFISETDEMTTLGDSKRYDISNEKYVDDPDTYKFSFYVNGEKVDLDANGEIPAGYKDHRYNYAKVGFDHYGDVEYVSAYTLNSFIIVDSVQGDEMVGVEGEGTGGSFDAKEATIVKNGKVIAFTDVQKGDLLFFNREAGFAEVYNQPVTGEITQVFSDAVEVNGQNYKYINGTSLSEDFGGLDYQNAVYINKDGETEQMDDNDAEALQAAGPVSIYRDRAGNTAYIAGETAVGNEKTVVLTDAITTDLLYGDYHVKVEGLLPDGRKTEYITDLNDLDKMQIDGVEYDIDDQSKDRDEWTASFDDAGKVIILTNNADRTKTREVHLDQTGVEGGVGSVVHLYSTDDGKLKEIEFFTTVDQDSSEDEGAAELDNKGIDILEAGDTYIKTAQGSMKLTSNTIVFDAYQSGNGDNNTYHDKDIDVTTWGQYNGADIDKATAVYDNDYEVLALVIHHTTISDPTNEEMFVTDTLRNTDNEVISITGYINGEKKTLKVDKISSDVHKNNVVILVTDDHNGDLVKGIYYGESAINSYLEPGYVQSGLEVTKVDVGKREVTFSNGKTYKLVTDGLVIDGTNENDITVETLSDLRNQKNVTVTLDVQGGNFAKFFMVSP